MTMALGLLDPRPGAIPLRLATYCDFNKLPLPPYTFGHYQMIEDWGICGNDDWGDCAFAGSVHQTMLNTLEGGSPASFSTATTLGNYSALTGFNQNAGPSGDNPTDGGTDLGKLADYWINTGIFDDNGVHHKIVAVLDMNPGDLRELWVATYLFQSVGMGFALPNTAQEQTQEGRIWDVESGAYIVGGHYVPCFGRDNNGLGVGVTWGNTQKFTPAFYSSFNNQGICGLSEEALIKGRDIDGFDDQLLRADFQELAA
jgi:hypothetical protein